MIEKNKQRYICSLELKPKRALCISVALMEQPLTHKHKSSVLMRTINHIESKCSCWACKQRLPSIQQNDHAMNIWYSFITLILFHLLGIRLKIVSTSLISLILEPPLPISEPHWLAGNTRRSVTGGLLDTVLFTMQASISCNRDPIMSHPLH